MSDKVKQEELLEKIRAIGSQIHGKQLTKNITKFLRYKKLVKQYEAMLKCLNI